MSVSQAQAEANCLTDGCAAVSSATLGAVGLLVVAVLAIAAVVGTVVVIEWRSYARRRSRMGLIGGCGERWPNGVPPAAAGAKPQNPMGPDSGGPAASEDPTRRL
jgi:hypothetical protein